MLLLLSALLTFGAGEAQEVAVQPFQTLHSPDDCVKRSSVGDHLLVQYDFRNMARPTDLPIFATKTWEQRHYVLGDTNSPPAFNKGLVGMCPGEKRRLVFGAPEFGVSAETAKKAPTVVSDVELLSVITPEEYTIFDLMEKGDIAEAMELVENRVGVNAVDQFGNSALMVAVQGGTKFQMVVAGLLNAWQPKVNVDFAKPSGHSVLFYAATQDDMKGTAIMKALLTRGADPNVYLTQGDMLGWTPLHFACKSGNIKHATLLLEYGANALSETADGKSVLDVAKDVPYSVRKQLANVLNEALERVEDKAIEPPSAPIISAHSEL